MAASTTAAAAAGAGIPTGAITAAAAVRDASFGQLNIVYAETSEVNSLYICHQIIRL